jgi:chaperonin cofactor prefoldin
VTVLAAAYALTRPDIYRYQASVRLGVMVMEGGPQIEPIVSPAAAQAQLETGMIPAALRRVLDLDAEELAAGSASIPEVLVTVPHDANIIHVSTEGPEEKSARYLDILHAATAALVRDHADVLATERIRLTRQIERLDRAEEHVVSRLEDIRSQIERLAAIEGAAESTIALRIDGLQQRAGDLEDRLLEVQSERDQAHDYLSTIKEYENLFNGGMDMGNLAQQQEAGNRIAAMSGGIRPTAIISAPHRSLARTGTSATLIVALGVVLGGILGVFAGFIAEFVAAARRRNRPTDDTGAIEHRS